MADKFLPDFPHLPANLPEDWEWDQIISPNGSDAGKPAQYGYNYLMQMVNRGHQAANMLRNAAESFSSFSENFIMDFAALNDDLAHRYTKPEVDDLLSTKVNVNATITRTTLPLLNGWTQNVTTRYSKDSSGLVHVNGIIRRAAGLTSASTQVATLPSGFRPAVAMAFPYGARISTANAQNEMMGGYFNVATNGNVTIADWFIPPDHADIYIAVNLMFMAI